MLIGDKNLRNDENGQNISYKTIMQTMSIKLSYTRTNKLITALYMVTDIIDNEEPLKYKLRTLGIEILSDTFYLSKEKLNNLILKIEEILSFLNIVSAMNFISDMNINILKKEFLNLKESLKESLDTKQNSIEEFLFNDVNFDYLGQNDNSSNNRTEQKSIGQNKFNKKILRTRIGVQKGSTLLKVLSDKTTSLSNNNFSNIKPDFDLLKKQRRFNIINVIKDNDGNGTIKDILFKINLKDKDLNLSEKTLQRELMSMIKDGVLKKAGEKRWSKYFLISNLS